MSKSLKVLLVEDRPEDAELLLREMKSGGLQVSSRRVDTAMHFEEALESFSAAIAVDPERAEAHYNQSLVRLRLGNFKNGWPQFEWRWKKFVGAGQQRFSGAPLWRGDAPLADKTILLLAEQGLGDSIHFMRYAPLVAALGARVVLGVQSPLQALAATVPGVTLVAGEGEPLPPLDFHCPLLSLPLAFKTDRATVPANVAIAAHRARGSYSPPSGKARSPRTG